MTLNDIYLVSQIAAVVLVAPSILYLALQVRQNTQQLRATARFQWVEASDQFCALVRRLLLEHETSIALPAP